jgi:hypothetical protein
VISITNNGSAAGNNIIVTDNVADGQRIDRVVTPVGTSQVQGQEVSVTIPTLLPGQTIRISIFTTLTHGIPPDNTACLIADGLSTPRCAQGVAVARLPLTGATPTWRNELLLAVGIGLSLTTVRAGFLLWRRG